MGAATFSIHHNKSSFELTGSKVGVGVAVCVGAKTVVSIVLPEEDISADAKVARVSNEAARGIIANRTIKVVNNTFVGLAFIMMLPIK
jgi:hypothetical protein